MSIRYIIVDSHRNISQIRKDKLIDFFGEVKGISEEESEKQVFFCDWFESEYAVKWFEVIAVTDSDIAGYLRCFRNPDDICQWYIGDVHVRSKFRRQGIASKMYSKVFKELERYEATENVISAVGRNNEKSIALHKKMGFTDTGDKCEFASFYVDENETKYHKWLYRNLPVPEYVEEDKLFELFIPIWEKYKKTSGADTEKELTEIIRRMKNNEFEAETIWCGNRLVGFTYLDLVICVNDIDTI